MNATIIFNDEKYSKILEAVKVKSASSSKCKELLNIKNCLFEQNIDKQNELLRLDELLSDYYNEILLLLYFEVAKEVMAIFCSYE